MQTKTKLYGLDHLRALAITLVFLFHYGHLFPHPEWTNTISKFGWTGVDLFFVLSGYLIASRLFSKVAAGHNISLREFYLKRTFRIIPAYLIVVAVYFCLPAFREREALAPLWKYLTFTQNIGLNLRTNGTFSHAWSLCIEEQFYLCLPIILYLLVRSRTIKHGYILLICLFLSGFVIRYCSYQWATPLMNGEGGAIYWYEWIYYPTWCRLDGLLIGISIAALFQFRPSLKNYIYRYGSFLPLLGLLILVGAYYLCMDELSLTASVFGFPLVAIGYGVLVMGVVCPGTFLYRFGSRVTSSLAALSYSVYLTHKILIHITQESFGKIGIAKDGELMFFICVVVCLAGSALLNRIIERPFLKLREILLAKKRIPQGRLK